jgi:hypothetical protein
MSIDDERDLRLRLDSVLEAITPSPAPVPATLRRGRTIRTRRRIGVAVSLAAAVGIALAAPSLAHQVARQPPVTRHEHKWILTVDPPGPHPPPGLIGWGTINGKRWRISIDASLSSGTSSQCLYVVQTNGQNPGSSCGPPINLDQDPSPAQLELEARNDGVSYEYGVVQPDVARVVIALPDDSTLTLRPYRLHGQRWVTFAVPTSLPIASATAYSNRSELGYAIPYGDKFTTWLRPGERGLPRATYVIGSGVASGLARPIILHAGPWGYCFSTSTCTAPLPRTATNGSFIGSTSGGGWTILGQASPSVAYVVGTLSDGSTVRARAVDVGGPKLWAWAIPRGRYLRRVVFYSASGHQIAVQSGAKYPPRG